MLWERVCGLGVQLTNLLQKPQQCFAIRSKSVTRQHRNQGGRLSGATQQPGLALGTGADGPGWGRSSPAAPQINGRPGRGCSPLHLLSCVLRVPSPRPASSGSRPGHPGNPGRWCLVENAGLVSVNQGLAQRCLGEPSAGFTRLAEAQGCKGWCVCLLWPPACPELENLLDRLC